MPVGLLITVQTPWDKSFTNYKVYHNIAADLEHAAQPALRDVQKGTLHASFVNVWTLGSEESCVQLTGDSLHSDVRDVLNAVFQRSGVDWIRDSNLNIVVEIHYGFGTAEQEGQHTRSHWKRGSVSTKLTKLRSMDESRDGDYSQLQVLFTLSLLTSTTVVKVIVCVQKDVVDSIRLQINTCPCAYHRKIGRAHTLLSDLDIWDSVKTFLDCKSNSERGEYVTMSILENYPEIDTREAWLNQKITSCLFTYMGETHCFYSYCALRGFGHYRVRRMMEKKFNHVEESKEVDGDVDVFSHVVQDPLDGRKKSRAQYTRDFLKIWVDYFVEYDPMGRAARMPMMIRKEIYEDEYMEWMTTMTPDEIRPVSYRWFMTLWKQEFGGKVRMTDKHRFAECSFCSGINKAFFNATTERKRDVLLAKCAHLEAVRNYRRHATTWLTLSRHRPRDFVFLMVDAMDSNKTHLPADDRMPKWRDKDHPLKVKITNVITHRDVEFYWQDNTTNDRTSLNIHIVLKALRVIKGKQGGMLRRNLLMVMDSASNNKSSMMSAFIAFLVGLGSFDSAQLLYMPVGHTHWLCDQVR